MQNFPHLQAALSALPRLPYDDWLNIISALTNEFGAENAQSILFSSGFRDERRGETAYKARKAKRNIHFGTLVHILRAYGINATNVIREMQEQRGAPTYAAPRRIETARRAPKSAPKPPIFRFADYELEERAAIYQHDAKMTHSEAFERVLRENPSAKYERVFRVMLSEQARNKEILCAMNEFNTSFRPVALTRQEMQQIIKQGFAFMPCLMRESGRKNDLFAGSEIICVDIDGGKTIEDARRLPQMESALFGYTTPSHTPETPRFRIVWGLPLFETSYEFYRQVVRAAISIFCADEKCSDAARFFFGNTDAIFFGGVSNGK